MQVSAEFRVFWPGRGPEGLESWFLDASVHGCPAGGGLVRTDVYLYEAKQGELGIKQRGSKPGVEVKGLVARLPQVFSFGSENIEGEIWCKWSSGSLTFPKELSVTLPKARWLRKFDTGRGAPVEIPLNQQEGPVAGTALPERGCNVEWTTIAFPGGETVSTLGFESFGGLGDVEGSLRAVAAVMDGRNPPRASGGFRGGYPAWIAQRDGHG